MAVDLKQKRRKRSEVAALAEPAFLISTKGVKKLPGYVTKHKQTLERIKNATLGQGYELSLVFCNDSFSKKLNTAYRGKAKSANVLSFPLSKKHGELFLTSAEIKRQHALFSMSEKEFTFYLFIHGLLHLKGFDHGSKMEREEKRLLKALLPIL